jgi:primosomal protein N''
VNEVDEQVGQASVRVQREFGAQTVAPQSPALSRATSAVSVRKSNQDIKSRRYLKSKPVYLIGIGTPFMTWRPN